MQANTITIPSTVFINEALGLDASASTLTLKRVEETINRSTYSETVSHAGGVVHTDVLRNQVQFYRTFPKRSGASRGAAKLAAKFTRDISVANSDGSGDIVLPLIGEVSFSIPVGATHDQISNLRRRIWALLEESADSTTEDASVMQLLTEGSREV